jgi:hypothetical protein
MRYRIEIYRPGKDDLQHCLKTFTSATPFLPVRNGDLIDIERWVPDAPSKLLRVANIEHVISEQSLGIDPSGGTTHRMLIFTEGVPDQI